MKISLVLFVLVDSFYDPPIPMDIAHDDGLEI